MGEQAFKEEDSVHITAPLSSGLNLVRFMPSGRTNHWGIVQLFFFFKIVSLCEPFWPGNTYVDQAALNSQKSAYLCFCFLGTGIKGVSNHTWQILVFWDEVWLCSSCWPRTQNIDMNSGYSSFPSARITGEGHHTWHSIIFWWYGIIEQLACLQDVRETIHFHLENFEPSWHTVLQKKVTLMSRNSNSSLFCLLRCYKWNYLMC